MQTSYSLYQQPFVHGQVVDASLAQIDATVIVTDANGLAFGLPVKRGTSDDSVVALAAGTDKVFGVTINSATTQFGGAIAGQATDDFLVNQVKSTNKYPVNTEAQVLRFGRIALKVDTITAAGKYIAPGNNLYYDTTAKTYITSKDNSNNPDVPNNNSVQIGVLQTTAVAGSIAIVQINTLSV